MGLASSLFFSSNNPDKQTLHKRITPSTEQFEEQQERWNALADYLVADLRQRSGYPMRTWLQGSYKFGTQVRPARYADEFDIDLGIYYQWQGVAQDGAYGPDELKTMIQESLCGYDEESVIEVVAPPKERCSRIRFEGSFHIDVPGYHLDPDRDARMLATETNGWEDSDPKALYQWFVGKFDDQKRIKARRHIRYLKIWAGLKFANDGDRPSSTLLTVLVAEAIELLSDDELSGDDAALTAVLRAIVIRLDADRMVPNPAIDGNEDLAQRLSDEAFGAFTQKLGRFLDTAEAALACEDMVSAADKWSEEFEHFFPMPEEADLREAVATGNQLPVPLVIPEVQVRAVSRTNRNKTWDGTNSIGPIPKGCDINFSIINRRDIPHDAEIQWTVRNEGDEAEHMNDLGHKAEVGVNASERSAYKGIHYMDCVIRRYGVIVGMRRIPVEITGMFIPRRNPKRRPDWVKLRGRR